MTRTGGDWLVDAHLDLAWNALQWNRDLREPVHVLRVREATLEGPGRGRNTVALPELREGQIRLVFATLLARSSGTPRPHVDFDSFEQANAVALGQLAYYQALQRSGHVALLGDRATLDAHVKSIDEGTGPLGVVIAMEGADPILDPDDVGVWAEAGLRLVGLAHYGPGRYAGGTGTSEGLTDAGRALLPRLAEAGIALDLTHLSDTAFWEAIDAFDGPIHVSHGNARALVGHQRQLSDEQIRAVVRRGGVIGAALDVWMLEPGWVKRSSRRDGIGLERVCDHIAHVCELAGGTQHAGLGSDLDGGFGTEQSPEGLETVADLARIGPLLSQRGFGPSDVQNVLHGNWLRWLREAWAE